MGLLQSQQLAEQDGFVTTRAITSQTEGMAKEPTLLAAALTERTFTACRALVEGVGNQRPLALEVSAEVAQVHAGECLMAEPKRTLLTRRATVPSTGARQWSIAHGAAAGSAGEGRTVTRKVTGGPLTR